jgi:hypothetical protein
VCLTRARTNSSEAEMRQQRSEDEGNKEKLIDNELVGPSVSNTS